MIKGFLMAGMLAASHGVIYLIYGKRGMEIRERQGKENKGLSVGIMMLLIVWLMCLFFSIIDGASNDRWIAISVAILIPIALFIAGVAARKQVRQFVENEQVENNTVEELSGDIENLQAEEKGANSPQYGLVAECPVFMKGEGSKKTYLDCLSTKDGEALSFRYKRSVKIPEISGL